VDVIVADLDCNNIKSVIHSIKDYKPDCHFTVVDSGWKCLDMIRNNHQQDLIILGTELVDIFGLDLIEKIRDDFDIPIIFLSRDNDVLKLVKALEVGANDYIVKPINRSIFTAKVNAIIRRYQWNCLRMKSNCVE
jgi:DNA-binding response OmpR family regulator